MDRLGIASTGIRRQGRGREGTGPANGWKDRRLPGLTPTAHADKSARLDRRRRPNPHSPAQPPRPHARELSGMCGQCTRQANRALQLESGRTGLLLPPPRLSTRVGSIYIARQRSSVANIPAVARVTGSGDCAIAPFTPTHSFCDTPRRHELAAPTCCGWLQSRCPHWASGRRRCHKQTLHSNSRFVR